MLSAVWNRPAKAPRLRSDAFMLLTRDLTSDAGNIEVVWSFFTVPAAVL